MSLPKLYKTVESHNAAVRDFYSARLDRPALIVGNGPSSASPMIEHLRGDAVVFRMNWFFLEKEALFGRRVDGYFWSVDVPALREELLAVVTGRRYQIGAFFAPMRLTEERGGERAAIEPFGPTYDHWALIATQPTLAREMMGRPLPTQAFQVLAFALALGFGEIHLAGIDLYKTDAPRYPFAVPERIARRLPAKDRAPGYESHHSRDRDLSFVATCRDLYPNVRIHSVSDSPFLRRFSRPAPRPSDSAHPESAHPESAPSDSAHPESAHPESAPSDSAHPESAHPKVPAIPEATRRWKEIGGHKCAYVTMVSPGPFLLGVAALARSLRALTDVPLVVMCLPGVEPESIAADNIIAHEIEAIENPNKLNADSARFAATYSKLQVFGLSEWDRLVYIDADAIALQNIDELFELSEFAAAPDLGIKLCYERFNSGVFACQPSRELFAEMQAKLGELASYDGGDQGFLNAFFPAPLLLDPGYNVLKRLYLHHPNLFRWEDVKVLHFTGRKPWETLARVERPYEELERRWFALLTPLEVVEIARGVVRPAGSLRLGRKLRKLRRDPLGFVRDSPLFRSLVR